MVALFGIFGNSIDGRFSPNNGWTFAADSKVPEAEVSARPERLIRA
jgi:hypothetical protein